MKPIDMPICAMIARSATAKLAIINLGMGLRTAWTCNEHKQTAKGLRATGGGGAIALNPGSRGHAPLTKTAQTRPRARLDALRLGARVALDLSYASGGQVLSQACPRAYARAGREEREERESGRAGGRESGKSGKGIGVRACRFSAPAAASMASGTPWNISMTAGG